MNYHRVLDGPDPLFESEPDVTAFRWQMELLATCFNVLPLHGALNAFNNGQIPPRAVCITFDDGYRTIYDLAFPILQEMNLPATVFATTGTMDGGMMWNDTITEAIRRLTGKQLDLRDIGLPNYSIATVDERKKVIHHLILCTKYLAPAGRSTIIRKLESLISGKMPGVMLSRAMIAKMARHDIEIGGHTVSHPILTSVEDDQARHEIQAGKHQLEEVTGKQVRFFAYPNGKPTIDFESRHVQMVKDAGYSAAFTTVIQPATSRHDRYHLPRSRPWDTTPFLFTSRLLAWLAGRAY